MEKKQLLTILDKIDAEYRVGSGDNISVSCLLAPWKHESGTDRNPSMSIKADPEDESLFNCFGCGSSGTLEALLWEYYGYVREDDPELGEEINSLITEVKQSHSSDITDWEYDGPNDSFEDNKARPDGPQDVEVWDESELELFSTDLPKYLKERGLTLDTAERWDIRFDKEKGRIVFPVRRIDGSLVGLVGRSIVGAKPKYKSYWGFRRALFLYGEHHVDQEEDRIVVVEGPLDAIMFDQYGISNTVATLGTSVSDNQKERILKLCNEEEVVIAFDGDKSGREMGKDLADDLREYATVRMVEFDDGDDPADVTESEAKELVEEASHVSVFGAEKIE